MHNIISPCKVAVAAGARVKDQMVVASEDFRECPKVRIVLRVEQGRKSTRYQNLSVTNPVQHVVCKIGGPLLSGVIHHYIKAAITQKSQIRVRFTCVSSDCISGY